jgi:hypothetical protein
METKKVLASLALVLSLAAAIFAAVKGEELRIIWNNGKILCLTCIGIK